MRIGKLIGYRLNAAGWLAALPLAAQLLLPAGAGATPPLEIRWGQGSGGGGWTAAPSRSFLGVGVRELDPARSKEKHLAGEYGVEITKVNPDSAADKAGLMKGDVVLEYAGQRVDGVEQFKRLVRETPVGRKVEFKIHRDGRMMSLAGVMGACDPCSAIVLSGGGEGLSFPNVPNMAIRAFGLPDVPRVFTTWRSSMLGIEAEALQSQLAGYFGVADGVLIRSVVQDSPAQKADLRAGDVILKVAGVEVASPREVTLAIQNRQQSRFEVVVMRNRELVTLQVHLEDGRFNNGRLERFELTPVQYL